MSRRTLVLCGNGASAVLLVCALARQVGQGLSIVIIGKGPAFGHGIAYATRNPNHLLNVPAGRMSADINRPNQFVDWLAGRGVAIDPWPQSFVSRGLYGEYLSELLDTSIKTNSALEIRMIKGEVQSLMRKNLGWIVSHGTGTVDADLVVLATGNDLPQPIAPRHPPEVSAHISDDPWTDLAVGTGQDILILGSGLTAIDVAINLQDNGHTGKIHLLSRRGLLPQTHVEPAAATPLPQPFPATARGFMRAIRAILGRNPAHAQWQGLMDAMRPHWPEVWQSFSPAEKKRFLRHGVLYWNIHRHRLAPKIGRRVEQSRSQNVHLLRGRLAKLSLADKGGVIATIVSKGRAAALPIGHVVNCTGPNTDPEKAGDRLVENLIASRLARATEPAVGLDVDNKNRVLDARGIAQPSLLAMGALTRSRWWEITAVPEIARQAQIMSGGIMEYLGILNAAARVNRRT